MIIENTKKMGKWVLDSMSSGFTNIINLTANFVLCHSQSFLLKDGPDFSRR